MTALAAILALVLEGAAGTSPRENGLLAERIRGGVADLYSGLETASMRLVADTAAVPDTLRCLVRAESWSLERDGGPRPGGSEVVRLLWKAQDGSIVRQDLLAVRVSREEFVPIARRRLGTGEILDTTDLVWSWRRTDGSRTPPLAPTGLQGRRVRRGTGPGQELSRTALEEPYLFHRKDRVRLVMAREGTAMEADAIALDDGLEGRLVRVEGPFGKVVRARVQADSSVRVE